MADTLTASYDKQEDIPETADFRALFTEKNGQWELTGITGIKTQADVDRVQVSLTKERDDHKTTKTSLAVWSDLDHEDVMMYSGMFEISDDGNVVTRDGVGVAPGLDADAWLGELQERKPHWWPASQGGGARGTGGGGGFQGKNPWTAEGWNMTEQGKLLRDKGKEYADRMAAAAGTTVGGSKPKEKAKA